MSTETGLSLHLPARYLEIVRDILRRYLPQAEVWAYGSRVNGDHYDASDLDLVVRQPDDLTRRQPDLDEVAAAFSDSDLPILVQIVDWARIPPAFHEEIESGYVVLQAADSAPTAPTDGGADAGSPFSLPRSSVGVSSGRSSGPSQTTAPRSSGRRDAGASRLAPTPERNGIQIKARTAPSWRDTTIGQELTLQRGFDITRTQQRQGVVPVVSSGGISSFHDTAMVKGPGVVLGRKGVIGSVY